MGNVIGEGAEEELQWYRRLLKIIKEGVWTIDANNDTNFINESGATILGYQPEEMMGRPVADFFFEEDRAGTVEHVRKLERGEPLRGEWRLRRKECSELWVLFSSSPLMDEGGHYDGSLIVFTDITTRKHEEEKNAYLAYLLDSVSDAIITNDANSLILSWNKAAEAIYGFKADEIIGKPIVETLKTEMIDGVVEKARGTMGRDQVWHGEVLQHKKDGTPLVILSSVTLVKRATGPPIYVAVNHDVTNLRRIDEALRESEELFRSFADQSIDGIAIISEEGRFLEWNRGMEMITGYRSEETNGRYFWDVQYELSTETQREHFTAEMLKEGMTEALRTGQAPFFGSSLEAQLRRKDGQVRWIHQSAFPMRTARGYRIGTIVRDVTNERNAELTIIESETKYRSLFENLHEAVSLFSYVLDEQGEVIDWSYLDVNEAVAEATGIKKRYLIGKTVRQIFGDEAMQQYLPIVRKMRSEKRSTTFESHFAPLDTYVLEIFTPLSDERFIVSSLDITDRKKMEMDLRRSNADLERFAYIASHDLQEPIRMILSFTDLIQKHFGNELDPKAQEYFGYVVDGADRMRDLINDLLTYSRIGTAGRDHTEVDMNKVVANTLKALGAPITEGGAIVEVGSLPKVRANRSQMAQLVQNLLTNALKFRGPRQPSIAINARERGNEWVFSIRDNGIGIPKGKEAEIFQMFHRLHAPDEIPGTGMGLSISRKIVEQHGGRIWVESEEGVGSTFYFTLPKAGGSDGCD